jgi:FkbM family methyltransferase
MINIYRRFRRVLRWLQGRDVFLRADSKYNYRVLGNPGADWAILPELINQALPVYSFGIGEDLSFDLTLINEFNVAVEAFDPTPRSIQWVNSQNLPKQIRVNRLGISAQDGQIEFQPPANKSHVSYRQAEPSTATLGPDLVKCPVSRLETIMRSKGHEALTILKLDIEGMEYQVIDDILDSGILPTQLLVEYHHRWYPDGADRTKASHDRLKKAGYLLYFVSTNGEECSFVHSSSIK